MTEKEFDMLIKRAISEHIDDYIPESEIDYTPHKFSKEFENKMNKLMGKPSATKHITHKKIITYIAVAIVAASMVTLSVGAVREAFIRFITNIFQTHTDVMSVTDKDAPLDFSDKYEITANMTEFELFITSENVFTREYIYQNEHCTIIFNQYIKEYYDVTENTEGYDMEVISINGSEGYYIDLSDLYSKRIAWDNRDYVFSISVTYDETYQFGKNELFEIANSVQKIEETQ